MSPCDWLGRDNKCMYKREGEYIPEKMFPTCVEFLNPRLDCVYGRAKEREALLERECQEKKALYERSRKP